MCATWARARLRARKPRPRPLLLRKMTKKSNFISHFYWRSARVQPRARPFSARQSILLIKEILFDYLIDSVAQKLEKIESDENQKKLKNVKKFENF